MKRVTGSIVLAAALLHGPAVFGAEGGAAEPATAPAKVGEIIEMHGVDKIETLLSFVQKMTDKTIVYDSSIRATKVKIFGPARIPKKDLLRFVETILSMNGCMMAEAPGNVLRVVPVREITEPISMYTGRGNELPESSEVVTQVIRLEYANSAQINALLRGLITAQTGKVTPFDDLNLLFVTDSAFKLRMIMRVIELVDVPAPEVKLETIKVEFAPVGEMARMLDTLLQRKAARERTGKKTMERAYIVADERSSALIVLGLPEEIEEIRTVLKSLDLPVKEIKGMFHAYQLKNTSAADLAKVLVDLYQRKAVVERTARPGAPPQNEPQPSIVPEPNTNSLLIIAPADVFDEMKRLIETLDVRRPQVLIEMMLVELSLDDTLDWGFEFATGDKPEKGADTIFAGTGFGFSSIEFDEEFRPVRVPSLGTGMFAGVFKDTNHVPVLLRAWETAGDVDVLSVPRVLTNDNSDAVISIGDEVPFQRTTIQNDVRDITWSTATAMMELKITPHISEAEHLRLDLAFKVERFGAQPDLTAPPPKSSRNATTKITVPDRSTVIIGGLTHSTVTDSETRIPLLHRIPLLGNLFKRTTKVKRKTHLFLFITPRILREETFGDLKDITDSVELKVKDLKKEDWKRGSQVWGSEDPRDRRRPEGPGIRRIEAPTVMEEEKTPAGEEVRGPDDTGTAEESAERKEDDAGKPKDPFKARPKRDRRER